MWRPQHATAAINAMFDNEKVVVARKLMLVYAMQATLLWSTAGPVARGYKTGVLSAISSTVRAWLRLTRHVTASQTQKARTYRSLSPLPLGCADGVVVLCNVQVQKVFVGKVVLALGAAVHVRLLVVHIVLFK